jgi:hypothetical protein
MDTVLAEDTDPEMDTDPEEDTGERDTVPVENTQVADVGKFSRRSVH